MLRDKERRKRGYHRHRDLDQVVLSSSRYEHRGESDESSDDHSPNDLSDRYRDYSHEGGRAREDERCDHEQDRSGAIIKEALRLKEFVNSRRKFRLFQERENGHGVCRR